LNFKACVINFKVIMNSLSNKKNIKPGITHKKKISLKENQVEIRIVKRIKIFTLAV
jgi:hypothetical protein